MDARDEFDEWASEGKDEGMEERHWHTAKHVLARMPIEPVARSASEAGSAASGGDAVLDLGSGSGYAARAMCELKGAARAYGVDASDRMARNARSYTDRDDVGFFVGDFEHLPFADDALDHCFSMEAFYYAREPESALAEVSRVLRPGGTFFCAVNYWEENDHSHAWDEYVDVPMTRWSEREYRDRFREAGFHVASQDRIPDRETDIPSADAFPTEDWDTREAMVERYREFGTLLTVGVVP